MKSEPNQWTCPPPTALTEQQAKKATKLYSEISRLRAGPLGPASVAGLEIRAALMLLNDDNGFRPVDNIFWEVKCRSLFLRPAIEPILCSYWSRFSMFSFDEASAFHMASALAGRQLVYRRGPAIGRSVKGDVEFESHCSASLWLPKIASVACSDEMHLSLPMFYFAQTIMAHPFSDGNGRFARSMIHAALSRCAKLNEPALALAPAFYRRAQELGEALTLLSRSRDWTIFNSVFLSILEDSLLITKLLNKKS